MTGALSQKRPPRRPAGQRSGAEGSQGSPSASEDTEAAARRALIALDRLVGLVMREIGRPPSPLETAHATLPLSLELGPGLPDLPRRTADFLAAVRERVNAATLGVSAFREGHVYCFHTDQPESPYSSPPNAADVFAGYGPTGKPEWVSFPNLCLARKEPRVDRLYGDPPEMLAFVQGPGELDAGLLPDFGKDSLAYKLLGQVVLGLVPEDLDPRSRAERVALTIQLVETSQPGLRHRLRLNVLGIAPAAIATRAAEQRETSRRLNLNPDEPRGSTS